MPINILHLSANKTWGGGENHIENLCYELSVSHPEHMNYILCTSGSAFHNKLQDSKFPVFSSSLLNNFDPRYIHKLINICKKKKIDVIHIHDPRALALAVLTDHIKKLPPMVFSKKISFPVKERKQTLYKYNYPGIKRHLCVSDQTKEIMARSITDKSKLITIYHGTRLDNKSNKTPFRLREKLNISPDTNIVGNIANHHRAKHLDTLVEVANYLINVKQMKNIHFVQIGSFTEFTQRYRNRALEFQIEDKIHFLGPLPNASNFIPQFDVTLMTSTNEGIPQVIYESFYHKTPVVSTNVAGIPEVVDHGKNGLLADKLDHKGLGNHIVTLLNNPLLVEKFVDHANNKLHEKYTTANMAQQTLTEYKKVINGRH